MPFMLPGCAAFNCNPRLIAAGADRCGNDRLNFSAVTGAFSFFCGDIFLFMSDWRQNYDQDRPFNPFC